MVTAAEGQQGQNAKEEDREAREMVYAVLTQHLDHELSWSAPKPSRGPQLAQERPQFPSDGSREPGIGQPLALGASAQGNTAQTALVPATATHELLGGGIRLFKKTKASEPVLYFPDRAAEELQTALQHTKFLDIHAVLRRKRRRLEGHMGSTTQSLNASSTDGDADAPHSSYARSSLQALVVDGQSLLTRMPRVDKRQLRKRQPGTVLPQQPHVPFELRTARLLGIPCT
mmetsp:Transcript_23979/g.65808  ORF Transcript_23979/g.65808 Transcript_23979/m.65808 type:complete len:230 (-) Transcript_23979:340-1029(-)